MKMRGTTACLLVLDCMVSLFVHADTSNQSGSSVLPPNFQPSNYNVGPGTHSVSPETKALALEMKQYFNNLAHQNAQINPSLPPSGTTNFQNPQSFNQQGLPNVGYFSSNNAQNPYAAYAAAMQQNGLQSVPNDPYADYYSSNNAQSPYAAYAAAMQQNGLQPVPNDPYIPFDASGYQSMQGGGYSWSNSMNAQNNGAQYGIAVPSNNYPSYVAVPNSMQDYTYVVDHNGIPIDYSTPIPSSMNQGLGYPPSSYDGSVEGFYPGNFNNY